MHYFSNLFDKVLYVFQTGPLSIIRSISTLYTHSASSVGCLLADTNRTSMTNTYCMSLNSCYTIKNVVLTTLGSFKE